MKIEVDQSGKVERLSHDTVIAASNGVQCSIKIPKNVKRNIFKIRGRIKQINYRLFCIGVYYCIERYVNKNYLIVIDDEYQDKKDLIKFLLISLIRKKNKSFDHNLIRFDNITKNSNAHKLAIKTFKGDCKPNEIITEKQILRLLDY